MTAAFRFAAELRDRYLERGLLSVPGWLDRKSARIVSALSVFQVENDIQGSVGEIGVHMGKLFLLLYLTSTEDQAAFAVDVFDRQDLNVDGSGGGDEGTFFANILTHAKSTDGIVVFGQSSLALRPADLISRCRHVRLISVDAGHTEECVLNDLRLAEGALCEAGVAIIDDVFNQEWPGVASGLHRYLADDKTILRPFAISQNKTYLSSPDHHHRYKSFLRSRFENDLKKSSTCAGYVVDIFGTIQQPARNSDYPFDVEMALRAASRLAHKVTGPAYHPLRAAVRSMLKI